MSPSSPPSVVANGSNVKYIDDIDASKDPQMANSEQIGSLPRPSFSNILVQLLHGKLPDDARRIELQNGAFGDASILSGGDASPSVVRSYQDGAQSIGHIKTLPPNSRRPIPFETDIFQGSIILLLRPKPPERDGVYEERIFGRKKRNVSCDLTRGCLGCFDLQSAH